MRIRLKPGPRRPSLETTYTRTELIVLRALGITPPDTKVLTADGVLAQFGLSSGRPDARIPMKLGKR